ncbi:MAG: MFS transporter [Deltaproteobacteria bacterium]|nr:MFS transporter [Deltaproteobacteria bacterium]
MSARESVGLQEVTSTRGQRFAWCLYDFANSAFPTVIVTAIYVLYFKNTVVGDDPPGLSDRLWGTANSVAAAIVFLTAPLLGAIADLSGRKRHFLLVYVVLCIGTTAALSLTGPGTVVLAMVLFIAAAVGFEGSCVFYNAFLPELVPPQRMGRLSGKGWALGYIGGLLCMGAVFPLAEGAIELVPLVVAAWFAVFAIPSLLALKDRPRPPRPADSPSFASAGLKRFIGTLRSIREYRNLARFFVAYFFYNNAVITIIVFAVAFSSDSLQFTLTENIILIGVMNLIAAPGAFVFGWVADRIGAKRTIVITLFMWLAVVGGSELAAWPGLFTVSGAKTCFWGVAGLASLCIGAIQATSRAFVGQLAPEGRSGEFYGFMAFAGKGSAILGPLVFGLASDAFDSQRVAVATIGVFFLIGLILLTRVTDPRRRDSTA